MRENTNRLPGSFLGAESPYALPLVAVAGVMTACFVVLAMSMKMTIGIAAIGGLCIFIGQIFAKDKMRYWTGVFILSIPLAAPKILGSREHMLSVVGALGVPTGAMPVPTLFFSDVILFILFCLWAAETAFSTKQKPYIPGVSRYALGFMLVAAISIVNSVNLSYSGNELVRLVKFFLIFLFAANNIRTKKDVKLIVFLLAFGILSQGVITIVQYKYQFAKAITGYSYLTETVEDKPPPGTIAFGYGETRLRGSGTVGPHNIEAMFFELIMPLLLSVAICYRMRLKAMPYIVAFALGAAGLYCTFSRGGMAGTAIGLVALSMLCIWKGLLPRWALWFMLASALVIGYFSYGKVHDFISQREGAYQVRVEMSKVGLSMVKEHPLLGFGLNTSVIHIPDYDPKDIDIGYPVHNHYLIIASEVGLIGLTFFLLFYYKILRTALGVVRSADPYISAVSIGIISGIVGISAHMGFDHFGNEVIQTLLWFFAGMVIALERITEGEEEGGAMVLARQHNP